MAEMNNGRILLDRDGDVVVMTLNDPSVLNAIGMKMRQDITQALDEIEAGTGRCLVITGNGRAFCSGANLTDPDRKPRDRAAEARGEAKSDLELWHNPTFMRLRNLDIPVVTAINGIAAGAGMSLALMGDMKIAGRSSYFLQAFARIGLAPDCGSSWILPRLIGMARAMELSMLAERLPAETAMQWGMVNRLVDDAEVLSSAMDLARRLAAGPRALGVIRRMYWEGMDNGFEAQLAAEARLQSIAGMSEDYTEGVTAFREKRPAQFKGR